MSSACRNSREDDALNVLVVSSVSPEGVLCLQTVDAVEVHEAADVRLLTHSLHWIVHQQWRACALQGPQRRRVVPIDE